MAKRKKIPPKTIKRVLLQCLRRCCLCFLWDNDDSQNEGQICHIDHQSNNHQESNPVFLCLTHHNRYDATYLQSKNIQQSEIKTARDKLYEHLAHGSDVVASVTITLNRDFETFTETHERDFCNALRQVAKISDEIRIVRKRKGSVQLTVAMSARDIARLRSSYDSGELADLGVSSITLPRSSFESPIVPERFSDTVYPIVVPYEQMTETVLYSDASEFRLFGSETTQAEAALLGIFVKHFRSGTHDSYCTLLLCGFTDRGQDVSLPVPVAPEEHIPSVDFAVRVYKSDIDYNRDWKPSDILKQFLKTFGYELQFRGSSGTCVMGMRIPAIVLPSAMMIDESLADEVWSDGTHTGERLHMLHSRVDITNEHAIEYMFRFKHSEYARLMRRRGFNIPSQMCEG